jgi:Fur family ferric uptake transcriptional regulator
MCHQCDYISILESHGLASTPNRLRVLEIIGNSSYPLSAQDIFETLSRTQGINKVTVYRILDLFVERKMAERLSADDRSFRYGLAPNDNHRRHPHFYCTHCGNMECLNPESLDLNMDSLKRTFPGLIEKVEVRIDGICKNCLKQRKANR